MEGARVSEPRLAAAVWLKAVMPPFSLSPCDRRDRQTEERSEKGDRLGKEVLKR